MTMHDGTAQNHRHPAPLQPDYFNVAEMDINTLLAIGVDYAGLVNYYNADNALDGNWTRIFSGDDTMVLAHITATDMARIEADFHNACNQPAQLRPSAAVDQAANSYRLAARLNDWYIWLTSASSKHGIKVHEVIAGVIRKHLAGHLHDLTLLMHQYPGPLLEQRKIDLGVFAPIWTIQSSISLKGSRIAGHQTTKRGTPEVNGLLQSSFHAFYNATSLVIETATAHFSQCLRRRNHEPGLALYIAFIRLFRQAQQHINKFVPQHRDYYYRDILQIRPAGATPDTTFLLVALDGSLPEVLIPKGTEFTAGKDDCGKTLVYLSDNDICVTDAAVKDLRTIFFEKNPLISPEKELGHVTGVKVATVPSIDIQTPPDSQTITPKPFFGAATDQAKEESGVSAQFGLAIADPILLLAQGQRHITISIAFDASPENHPAAVLRHISKLTATTPQDAFYKVFKRMFSIALTADTGWYAIEDYLPDAALIHSGSEENWLSLQINLTAQAPQIVAYDPTLHGGRYRHHSPMVRLCINDQNDLYPYSLLQLLRLKETRIDVAVRGSKDLLVYNNHGRIDPASPFLPFGPLPDLGSFLMVGSYEAALKRLSAWQVCLEWDNLPGGRLGMQSYYRNYDEPYLPGLYKVHATSLGNGRWHPVKQSERVAVNLFQAQNEPDDGFMGIAFRSVLNAHNLSQHTPLSETIPKNKFAYTLNTTGGFFKFTLADPPYAFGHKVYPRLLSRSLTVKALKKKSSPVPNPPYTPMVKSIEINYRAHSAINMEKGMGTAREDSRKQIIHLHPLGWERIYPPIDNRAQPILPSYDHAGALLIGLGGSKPVGTLTLFFHIRPSSAHHAAGPKPLPQWCYLSSNRWMALSAQRVIHDSTNAFTNSGIVTLDIPQQINRKNTILPDDCFWLRIAVDQDPQTAGYLFGVAAQALSVTWQNRDNCAHHLQTPLAAGTINQARTALAGIATISQPTASTKGRAPETGRTLITRISERLRHKNRAITCWDYERLVLEHFPEIYKVKCFAGANRAQGMDAAGHVLLAVIPQLPAGPQDPDQQPMADARLLDRIKDHLVQIASPFVAIEVCNPAYEQIQIRCSVKLHPSVGGGASIKHINQAINQYLSPWSDQGQHQACFSWCIRRADIESYLLGLEHVAYVTQLSMLHIVQEKDDTYGWFDTAHTQTATPQGEDIKPKYPWGIAVPLKHHYIETIDDYHALEPQSAGIDELKIGETFIIDGT